MEKYNYLFFHEKKPRKCQFLNISEAHEAKLQPDLKQIFYYKKRVFKIIGGIL